MAPTTTLVPPRRLGSLLRAARREAGLELETLSSRTGLSVVDLDDIEFGRRVLDEGTLLELIEAYGVDDAAFIPDRAHLVIDLDDGRIAVDETALDLGAVKGPDAVLTRYLSLVYRLRDLPIGTPLSLRDIDIEILAQALSLAEPDIETRLHGLIAEEDSVARDQQRIRRQLVMPLVGVVLAATTIGTLVLIAKTDAPPNPEVGIAVSTDIGNGGAIEENPGD